MTGPALTTWREQHPLSVAQLAHLLGVQRAIVWRWETRDRYPAGAAAVLLHLLANDDTLFTRLVAQRGVPRRYARRKKNVETP